ncbi:MAG: RDD family protein [Arenimonas sp.]
MSDKLWHYIDLQQNRHGPVAASVIKDAYQRGELGPGSLVWHAELPQWQSLEIHADALGIDLKRINVPMLNGREVKYANFFHRWAALMVDQWILAATAITITGIIVTITYFASGASLENDPERALIVLALSMIAYLPILLGLSGTYHIYFESSSRHGSWGKQFLGIEVRNEQGEFLDRSTAALRWFSATLSHLTQSIGFLIAAFTEKRQALHDFLAHTIVLEREASTLPVQIDRNKRALIILILGIFIIPFVIFASLLFPMIHLIEKVEHVETVKHQKIAALVVPIQQAIRNRVDLDNTCLSHEDAELKPLLQPLEPMVTEIYAGLSDDQQACEIYLDLGGYKALSYRYSGEGEWTCEASHKPADFGENCQLAD